MDSAAFKFKANRIIDNLRGWRTDRKILVIESDDWGSIRMPSKETYEQCIKAGYPVDRTIYERYDSLLTQDDLELLFDLLSTFRDKNGKQPIITANCVVANPDFEKIKQDNLNTYHYELITETFHKYPKHKNNFNLWKDGISQKIFFPQYHAREHLNVVKFMKALVDRDPDVLFGVEHDMPGCITQGSVGAGNPYIEATRFSTPEEKAKVLDIYLEGLDLFETLFGYKSETITPPNYTWSDDFNKSAFNKGVQFFQGIREFKEPTCSGEDRIRSHYLGERNEVGQTHLLRNAFFEPSSMSKLRIKDPVRQCLADMSIAFRMKKPAVICSHRINYCGFIDEKNRDRTLGMLKDILGTALIKWPDIEFMNSQQLGKEINRED